MIPFLLLERILKPDRIRERRERLAQESPVVVMGRGKSGTRLLAWALQMLGIAMGATERLKTGDFDDHRFLQTVKSIACRNLAVEGLQELRQGDLLRLQWEFARIRKRLPGSVGSRDWGWKWPETYLIAPYVLATFPRARFIHLVRDGRDLAFKHHLTDDPGRPLGRAILSRVDALHLPHYLQAARSWQFQVERYRRFAPLVPQAQRHELTYEALCHRPLEEMGRVAEFLGLPVTEACEAYVSAHFTLEQVAVFNREDSAAVQEVQAAIGDTLTAYGYLPPAGDDA